MRMKYLAILLAILVVGLIVLGRVSNTLVDWLWFSSRLALRRVSSPAALAKPFGCTSRGGLRSGRSGRAARCACRW